MPQKRATPINIAGLKQNPQAGAPATQEVAYEPPQIRVLGDVVELTKGSRSDDTADMKAYYY